jgi:hypothetical protein
VDRKTLKLIALGYVVKTLLVGAAWLVVPNLPQQVRARAREAWALVVAGR